MTTIQGFEYPSNIQFEERDDLLVQKNEPGLFDRVDTIRKCMFVALSVHVSGGLFMWISFLLRCGFTDNKIVNKVGLVAGALGILAWSAGALSVYRLSLLLRSGASLIPQDSACRMEWIKRFEEIKKMTGEPAGLGELGVYIYAVGFKNIEMWGLRLHPDSHPLITKEMMHEMVMNNESVRLLDQLFFLSLPTRFGEKFKLIDLLQKNEILSKEDKQILEKRLVHFLPIHQEMGKLDTFVEDLNFYGFNTTPEMQQALARLKNKKEEAIVDGNK